MQFECSFFEKTPDPLSSLNCILQMM